MKALILRICAITAVALVAWPAPARAQTLPEDPAKLFLKEHEDIPLAVQGGAAVLSADFDLWTLRPVEAMQDLGEYQIVQDSSGQCLTADTSGGEETVPVVLADCADALAWTTVYNDAPAQQDFRFTTADGYFLGLADDASAVEGAPILAVDPESDQSRHFQEWLFATPPPESPSPTPSESTSPPPQPQLPTTGTALGALGAAGAVALAGGAALVLRHQRRRALRGHW
ncbi:RICIN domain-containing protein [Glycomyces dulcitolivorans]|uniref:RICIN domain-containing protein n=1 Tax=Glycomyces dulcitolivorans TaxID=2200759 RepID=UPI0018E567BC|nr:LPXTG cell wall anchor domain-containing protein [Glycomyces dulcitolivorans]